MGSEALTSKGADGEPTKRTWVFHSFLLKKLPPMPSTGLSTLFEPRSKRPPSSSIGEATSRVALLLLTLRSSAPAPLSV